MVIVRPTIGVLKVLEKAGKLSQSAGDLYRKARASKRQPEQLDFLAQSIQAACAELKLVTYIQNRFDQGIFEKLKGIKAPVFESRDAQSPAWRGAVLYEGGKYAWLVYADTHDHFHAESAMTIRSMQKAGTLGPSELDLICLKNQEDQACEQQLLADLLTETLVAIEEAVAGDRTVEKTVRDLRIRADVDSPDFEEWEISTAHEEIDMLTLEIRGWEQYKPLFERYLRTVHSMVGDAVDAVPLYRSGAFILQILLSRAQLIALLAHLPLEQPLKDVPVPPRAVLHYAEKSSLTKAYVTGRAIRAVCGTWWVPIGDDETHGNLPVCPDCEREEPVVQALRNLQSRGH